MGYVCKDTEDLLKQYEEIIKKKHFGKTIIKEDWNLKQINRFLKEASKNIPYKLTEIIKETDFTWVGEKQEIG